MIDHILEQAKPAEKKVSVEELMKPMEATPSWLMLPHCHRMNMIMITPR